MIGGMRGALFAASLFTAAPAMAAQPSQGHYVWVPAGATVVLVPAAPAMPADFGVAHMFAEQEAMMRHMMADMNTLLATPLPDPTQLIQSVMNGVPQAGPGSGVMLTTVSSGNGVCSETITYGYPVNGGKPQVKVTHSGNACGAIRSSGPVSATQAPVPHPVAPVPQRRLWTIGDPPHPITPGSPPRT